MAPLSGELERLLVACLIGVLIGLERERAEVRKAHQVFAGIRTFPLIALVARYALLLLNSHYFSRFSRTFSSQK